MPAPSGQPTSTLQRFLASEAAGGIVLMAVAALALVIANSPLQQVYFDTLKDALANSRVYISDPHVDVRVELQDRESGMDVFKPKTGEEQ